MKIIIVEEKYHDLFPIEVKGKRITLTDDGEGNMFITANSLSWKRFNKDLDRNKDLKRYTLKLFSRLKKSKTVIFKRKRDKDVKVKNKQSTKKRTQNTRK